MTGMNKRELAELINRLVPKVFFYSCQYKVAIEGEILTTWRVVNAKDRLEATTKLRKDFKKHGYILVNHIDITII